MSSEAVLFDHIAQNHSDKLKIEYRCPFCPFSTTNVQEFSDHVHESTISICYCCNLPIYNQSVYDTHMDKHLRRGPAFCMICDMALANQSLVKLHQVVHACDRWFMCRDCGLCYSEESQADSHFKFVKLILPFH